MKGVSKREELLTLELRRRPVIGLLVMACLIPVGIFAYNLISRPPDLMRPNPYGYDAQVVTQWPGLTTRGPIYIEGDGNFTGANGVTGGSGTAGQPFLISGWSISSDGGSYGIKIVNTNMFFVISGCIVLNFGTYDGNGIYLKYAGNGTIQNTSIASCTTGISIEGYGPLQSHQGPLLVRNCTILNCSRGVTVSDGSYIANNVTINRNTIMYTSNFHTSYTICAIRGNNTRNLTISENVIHFSLYGFNLMNNGIALRLCTNAIITKNTLSGQFIYTTAIQTRGSNYTFIAENSISNDESRIMFGDTTAIGINNPGGWDQEVQIERNAVIINNTISGNFIYGINVNDSDNATIGWNNCACRQVGIQLQYSDHANVVWNNCNLTLHGITLLFCRFSNIRANFISRYGGIMYLDSFFTSDTNGAENTFLENIMLEFPGPLNAWGVFLFMCQAVGWLGVFYIVGHYWSRNKNASYTRNQWALRAGVVLIQYAVLLSLPIFVNFSLSRVGSSSGVAGLFYVTGYPAVDPRDGGSMAGIFALSGAFLGNGSFLLYCLTSIILLIPLLFEIKTKDLLRRQLTSGQLKTLTESQINANAKKVIGWSLGGMMITFMGNLPIIIFSAIVLSARGIISSYVLFVLPLWVLQFWASIKSAQGIKASMWAASGREKPKRELNLLKRAVVSIRAKTNSIQSLVKNISPPTPTVTNSPLPMAQETMGRESSGMELVRRVEKPMPPNIQSMSVKMVNIAVIRRQYEYLGGKVRIKAKVINPTDAGLLRVRLSLDLPESFRILRVEPPDFIREGPMVKLNDLLPGEEKAIAWVLEPLTCGKEKINGTITGMNAKGVPFAISMDPLEVEVRCPMFVRPEEASLPAVQRIFGDLPVKSERVYFLPKALPAAEAFDAAKAVISARDVRFVGTFAAGEGGAFDQTAWFYGATKVGEKRYVLTASVSEKDRAIRIFSACDDEAGCTGFLAEAGAAVRQALVQRGAASSEDTVRELICEKCGGVLPRGPDAGRDVKCPECGRVWTVADFEH